MRKEFKSTRHSTCFEREKEVVAVNDVSFQVYRDELIALLGNNGAGKSTLVNLLTGMVSPTSGRVTIDGCDLEVDRWKARDEVGCCLQQDILFETLTVEEHLWIFGSIKGIRGEALRHGMNEVINKVRCCGPLCLFDT